MTYCTKYDKILYARRQTGGEHINREQRRKLAKLSKSAKIKLLAAEMAKQAATPDETPGGLREGDKVKLNYQSILADPDYPRLVSARREFVEANQDKIFTVQFDEQKKTKPVVVCLSEDSTDPKWFWTDRELIKLNEDTEYENH